MPTTIEKGIQAYEHTKHPAYTDGQSATKPEDLVIGPAPRFREKGKWNAIRGAHQDANRERARSVAAIEGAGAGWTGAEHSECDNR